MQDLSSPIKDQIYVPFNRSTGVFELCFNWCSTPLTINVIVDPSWINIYRIYYCLYLLSLFLIPIFCHLLLATNSLKFYLSAKVFTSPSHFFSEM